MHQNLRKTIEENIMSEKKTRTLGAVIHDDFELLDLYGPLEMFGNVGKDLKGPAFIIYLRVDVVGYHVGSEGVH